MQNQKQTKLVAALNTLANSRKKIKTLRRGLQLAEAAERDALDVIPRKLRPLLTVFAGNGTQGTQRVRFHVEPGARRYSSVSEMMAHDGTPPEVQARVHALGKVRRKMSAAGRANVVAGQKARWAKVKAAKAGALAPVKKKRTMSPAALRAIRKAQKARWAKYRKEQANK